MNLAAMSEEEILQLQKEIDFEKERREALKKERDYVAVEPRIVKNYMRGFTTSLLWPEHWGLDPKPGGPWIWGNTDFDRQISRRCHDEWHRGFTAGIAKKRSLKLSVPYEQLADRNKILDILDRKFGDIVDCDVALPDAGFQVGTTISIRGDALIPQLDLYVAPHKLKKGTILHKVELKHLEKVFYLIKFGSNIDIDYIAGLYLEHVDCGKCI